MSVHFRFGWVDAGPSPDKLAQSTMATLSVEAGGTTVTSVLDRANRIYSDEAVDTLAEDHNDTDWADIRGVLPPLATAEPWARGYTLARAARERIRANGGPTDFARHGPMAIRHHKAQPPTRRIHGLVGADTPACITAPRGERTDELAQEFRVSSEVIRRQIQNHDLARVVGY